jgi:hypothetical protein
MNEFDMIDKLDEAIFADTGNEPKSVYNYLDYLLDNIKNTKITVLKNDKSLIETFLIERISKKGNKYNKPSIPFYTETGVMQRHCTYDFKIKPINKYIINNYGKENIKMNIGFSTDEIYRVKNSPNKKIENIYPLLKLRMSRNDCYSFFKKYDIRIPAKSSCYFCPFHSINHWNEMYENDRDSFDKSVELDIKIRNINGMKQKCYLHKSRKPLIESVSDIERNLFNDIDYSCDSGYCFV